MTNYSNYPRHRLVHNSCIICFSEHTYSWTPLTEKQKKYPEERIRKEKERIREGLSPVRRCSGAPRGEVWTEAGQPILRM